MPGQVWGLASAGGPVFLTSYAGKDLDNTVLTAVDHDGHVLWRRELAGHPRPPRVSADGTVWHAGPGSLTEVDANGTVLRTIELDHETPEHLGAFVLLPDGFCVSWLPVRPARVVPSSARARVARHDLTGAARWTTPVTVPAVRSPRVIQQSYWSPLLVSGDRVLATFSDMGSGRAGTYLLDAATGAVVAGLPPGGRGWHLVTGPGEFLLSGTGPDGMRFEHRDATGAVTGEWPAYLTPVRWEDIRGPGYENRLGVPSRFQALAADGTVHTGPRHPRLPHDLPGRRPRRHHDLLAVRCPARRRRRPAPPGARRTT